MRVRALWRPIAAAGVLAMLGAAAIVLVSLHVGRDDEVVHSYWAFVGHPSGPISAADGVMAADDGKYFVAVARDPALRRPEEFAQGRGEAAYRAQRPLLAWLLAAATFGHPTAWALLALEIALCGAAAMVLAGVLERRGAPGALAGALPAVPGVSVVLQGGYADLLGAVIVAALVAAYGSGRIRLAIGLTVAAVLTRETLVVVPLTIAVYELWRHRTRVAVRFAAAAFAYPAWLLVVAARYGSFPSDSGENRLALPFMGVRAALGDWGPRDVVVVLAIVALAATAIVRAREAERLVLIAFACSAAVYGEAVWADPVRFAARVMLPMSLLGALVLLTRARPPLADVPASPARSRSEAVPVP